MTFGATKSLLSCSLLGNWETNHRHCIKSIKNVCGNQKGLSSSIYPQKDGGNISLTNGISSYCMDDTEVRLLGFSDVNNLIWDRYRGNTICIM